MPTSDSSDSDSKAGLSMRSISMNTSDSSTPAEENTFIRNENSLNTSSHFEDDKEGLLPSSTRKKRYRHSSSLPSIILQKRLITLRSTLLAISLTLTLLVFWLLDSLKDPVFATLVDGNLEKHQPLAKMFSVAGTLFLVVMMEIISYESEKRKAMELEQKRMTDDEVQSGGGHWNKMSLASSLEHQNDDDFEADEGQIPIAIFKVVGVSYIVVFGVLSFILRNHHGFSDGEPTPATSLWHIMGYLQYISIESFGSIGVATFWSFANSTLSLNAAKSYYGFIIAMAQLGAIGGSTLATLPGVSIPNLFLLACCGIMLQIYVMDIYAKKFPISMNEDDDILATHNVIDSDYEAKHGTSHYKERNQKEPHQSTSTPDSTMILPGIHLILKYNYLLLILGVSCLYEVSLTCLDYEMKLIGLDRFRSPPALMEDNSTIDTTMSEESAKAFSSFMGRYGQVTNLFSLLLSYYAFPYLMDNFGLKHTLRLFPTMLLAITFMAFIALPMNLPVLFISMSLLKAMTYSINDPAKEILYIPTSNTVKFKAKFWIDVVGARVAKAIGSSINTYAGSIERIVKYGSLPSVLTAVALWIICYRVGVHFEELLETGEIIGSEEDKYMVKDASFNCITEDQEGLQEADKDETSMNIPIDVESEDLSGWESNVSIELVGGTRHPEHNQSELS